MGILPLKILARFDALRRSILRNDRRTGDNKAVDEWLQFIETMVFVTMDLHKVFPHYSIATSVHAVSLCENMFCNMVGESVYCSKFGGLTQEPIALKSTSVLWTFDMDPVDMVNQCFQAV